MSIQAKILLLLSGIVIALGSGLALLHLSERAQFQAIARERLAERQRTFAEFIQERGDGLKALVEDSTNWDELVRALVKNDTAWAARQFNEESLPSYQANAVWLYHRDGTLLHSCNNRYSEELRDLPIPAEARPAFLTGERTRHFFVKVPQGWMEIRGGTMHPSGRPLPETTPQGCFLRGTFGSMKISAHVILYRLSTCASRPWTRARRPARKDEDGLITLRGRCPDGMESRWRKSRCATIRRSFAS